MLYVVLVQALLRLLDPRLEGAALFVGKTLQQLLRQMPTHIAPALPQMLAAIVNKLAAEQGTLTIVSLLLVVVQLVHLDAANLVACLAGMPAPAGANRPC